MQEITDFIVTGLYQYLFDDRLQEELEETQATDRRFNDRMMILSKTILPSDLDIPETMVNNFNMPMWNKAIRELQKIEKYITPSNKLKYLINSLMLINNTFSLFTSDKDG
mmetsp:Transcript_8484/g.12987  ORF Transcript_8484/g.12987 Transcript_8484/m.12987 type:complete len:110 (+) Transcript_8484:3965-4294(+)